MRCVHGFDLGASCASCGATYRLIESKPENAISEGLDLLTQSIQGLSENVAKMMDERQVHVSIEDNWLNQLPIYKNGDRPKASDRPVKRGPVTDDEIKNLMTSAGMEWGPKGKTSLRYKIMMQEFAKSRGLID